MLLTTTLLLPQQSSTCLVHLTWIVCLMRGKWPNNYCFVGRCCQDLLKTAHHILDLRPGQAVKIGNVPVQITGASGRGISGYNLDRGWVVIECEIVTLAERIVDVKQLFNPGEGKKSVSWRKDAVERTSTQQRGPSGPPIEQLAFRSVEEMLEWGPCPKESEPPVLRLSSPEERERNAGMAIRVGVNMLQFCSVSNSPLTQ